jgi:hypothetical protein
MEYGAAKVIVCMNISNVSGDFDVVTSLFVISADFHQSQIRYFAIDIVNDYLFQSHTSVIEKYQIPGIEYY